MDFDHILDQAIEMLQRRGRLTYRTLKRQFQFDDDVLEDSKAALLYSPSQIVDDGGKGLIWTGVTAALETDNWRQAEVENRYYALLPEAMARLQSQRRITYRTLQ